VSLFAVLAVLLTLTAVFSWINHRWIRLPATVGVMAIALAFSSALLGLHHLGLHLDGWAVNLLAHIDFDEALLNGMLSFLLFAGALGVDLEDLSREKLVVGVMATVGVVLSTLIVGSLINLLLTLVGVELPVIYGYLFGALISPTDPVAVLAILHHVGAPREIETQIAGESLFNDGVGVVVFFVVLGIAGGGADASVSGALGLLALEVVGGVVAGLVLGYVAFRMLRSVDQYQVEILITLALVTGVYALAQRFHVSAPIAVVVAGLLIGNHGRRFAMSEKTREHLDQFWELVDEILNAVLFVLLGLELIVLPLDPAILSIALVVIPLVISARLVSIALPRFLLKALGSRGGGDLLVLTWGGLRGGISVAMALSLPEGPQRDILLGLTYPVVAFSILIQGPTVAALVRRRLGLKSGGAAS
jgi:CPA1 family monovalent cation:H+ antiporter